MFYSIDYIKLLQIHSLMKMAQALRIDRTESNIKDKTANLLFDRRNKYE